MKWNANNISEFLKVYQQYPVLWNTKDKDYSNPKLRDEAFQNLLSEVHEMQLIENMDAKQLKAKIKSIRDVYRQELHKIIKSKESGCGAEEVYSPKLAWFSKAHYLADVVSTRTSISYMDLSLNHHETAPDEGSESCRESAESDNDNNWPEERFRIKYLAKKRPPPATPRKRFKNKPAPEKSPSAISEAIYHLDKIAQNAAEEKPYDQFGKFVASELRQLPELQAILLQQEIQNSIIHSKLSSLNHEDN